MVPCMSARLRPCPPLSSNDGMEGRKDGGHGYSLAFNSDNLFLGNWIYTRKPYVNDADGLGIKTISDLSFIICYLKTC